MDYSARHASARRSLSASFAGIDEDVERIFLSLSKEMAEVIFYRYGTAYGAQAESYARKTYPKWKSGSVKLSGQTAERLLNLIPPLLSTETRFELVRKLRAGHLKPVSIRVATTPQNWRQDLALPIRTLVDRSAEFSIPPYIAEKVAWLASGDTTAAQALLAAAEQEEAGIRVKFLEAEFRRIDTLIANIEHTKSVTHEISLPQGTILVHIELPKKPLFKRILKWLT